MNAIPLRRAVVALFVAAVVTHDAAIVHAAPSNDEVYGNILGKAEDARKQGDVSNAIVLYVSAYEQLPGTDRASDKGEDIVRLLIDLADEAAVDGIPDPELTKKAVALIDRHLENIRIFNPGRATDWLEQERARLLAPLADTGPAEDPVAEAEASREVEERFDDTLPTVHEPAADVVRLEPASRRTQLSLGLTLGGVVGIAAGAALAGYGGWLLADTRSTYRDQRDNVLTVAVCEAMARVHLDRCPRQVDANRARLKDWRDDNVQLATIWITMGAAAATLGLAALVTGSVLLAKSGHKSKFALLPSLDRAAGVQVVGRF